MTPTRVLVIDDSAVVRRCVADLLANDPAVSVVGTAATGSIGVARFEQLSPDVVILDLEMPEMDGLATLARLRQLAPLVPVLIFSSHSERGATITLDALSMGADDYLHKPFSSARLSGIERLRDDLVAKVKVLARNRETKGTEGLIPVVPSNRPAQPLPLHQTEHEPVEVVVIGASTGGPKALADLLPRLQKEFPVPVLIVQHMPATFTAVFANRLDQQCRLSVREVRDGVVPRGGEVWIAPGDFHCEVRRIDREMKLVLHRDPPENSSRPSVDPLFRSAASCYGANVLGVILTGMGRDGLAGCRAIKQAGGRVLAQDEASSVVWGMPGFVVAEGLADRELALGEMAGAIRSLVENSRRQRFQR